jgi:hypothetical protein
MANIQTIQVLVDGPVNVVLKVDGVVDTSDVSSMTLVDPALLSVVDAFGTLATQLRIDNIVFDIEDQLDVELFWDATAPVRIWDLVGRGKIEPHKRYGGLQNNAGAGKTGKILMATQGWTAAMILSYSFTIELVKQWTPAQG